MKPRRVVPSEEFPAKCEALGCPHAKQLVDGVAERLAERPHCVPTVGRSKIRILHTNAYQEFPALRLFYNFDDEALYLLDVELYDPLQPEQDG